MSPLKTIIASVSAWSIVSFSLILFAFNNESRDPDYNYADEAQDFTVENISPELSTARFEETTFDFGKIKAGEIVTGRFLFHNTGDFPLVVEQVKTGDGGLMAHCSHAEIMPGGVGLVEFEFNSAGKEGSKQCKSITLKMNTLEKYITLIVQGEVDSE